MVKKLKGKKRSVKNFLRIFENFLSKAGVEGADHNFVWSWGQSMPTACRNRLSNTGLIGAMFVVPAAIFWRKGYFNSALKKRVLIYGTLIGCQVLLVTGSF